MRKEKVKVFFKKQCFRNQNYEPAGQSLVIYENYSNNTEKKNILRKLAFLFLSEYLDNFVKLWPKLITRKLGISSFHDYFHYNNCLSNVKTNLAYMLTFCSYRHFFFCYINFQTCSFRSPNNLIHSKIILLRFFSLSLLKGLLPANSISPKHFHNQQIWIML